MKSQYFNYVKTDEQQKIYRHGQEIKQQFYLTKVKQIAKKFQLADIDDKEGIKCDIYKHGFSYVYYARILRGLNK
jgi:hypothetical protein